MKYVCFTVMFVAFFYFITRPGKIHVDTKDVEAVSASCIAAGQVAQVEITPAGIKIFCRAK